MDEKPPTVRLLEIERGKTIAEIIRENDTKFERIEGAAADLKVSTMTYRRWKAKYCRRSKRTRTTKQGDTRDEETN